MSSQFLIRCVLTENTSLLDLLLSDHKQEGEQYDLSNICLRSAVFSMAE